MLRPRLPLLEVAHEQPHQRHKPNPSRVALDARRKHRLQHCGLFKELSPTQRHLAAQAHEHCLNCLSHTHVTLFEPHVWQTTPHTLLHRAPRRDVGQPSALCANRARQANRAVRRRTTAARPEPHQWRPHHVAPTKRRPKGPQHRPVTGLSNVVATLQQLQRLLG
ncbi:PREDICTED: uncharacterized protein LOC108974301 [Bactrocera latifrons]|uniref:uncharacterized protein LOC108974301 n=1 Tax=Bactrocera latifrons TaxID=174628 RepID=UPI0008DD530B|nr:PREDICTED: uncharacterized protein LOC108974301 [Bactrocera latifrons]